MARGKSAKANTNPKSTKATGPAETHKKAVKEFVEATKTLKDSITGESVLQGLLKHEEALKEAATAAKGKSDLAVQFDMQDELEPTRELGDFVTYCREAQKVWKAYSHSQTEKNRAKFAQSVA